MLARWTLLDILILLPFCLSCASSPPPADQTLESAPQSPRTPKITPPQIVPSIQDRPAPPILGLNYVETIGRPGQGAGQFLRPVGLALDHRGFVYVADSGNNRIQVVDAEGNFIAEFGVRGWRTGEFDNPTDVAINFQRTELLYVADTDNDRIQYCNLVDWIFHVMVGSGSESEDADGDRDREIELDLPRGIGIGRNGEVYVVDTGNHRFVQSDADGIPVSTQGSFGGAREQFRDPTDLVVDAHGNLYIVDSGNHRIKKYDFSGNLVQIWGTQGEAPGQFREPSHIALDRWNYLYVTDRGNQRIQVFTTDGQPVMEFNNETLIDPVGIAISKTDLVFVSDLGTNDIKVFQIIYRP
ncbi:MAG: hypothetical protein O7E52_04235 [Candidatus Poribacteria bacterium]|nr:hypothetical protein [Candidatus Poribacteria bacterium]